MTANRPLSAVLAQRLRGPYRALGLLDARLSDMQAGLLRAQESLDCAVAEIAALRAENDELRRTVAESLGLTAGAHDLLAGEIRSLTLAAAAEEPGNRRRLNGLREAPDYAAAWDQPRPLVSVTVATRDRPELLSTRSLPSILAQTHADVEVIVVGDCANEDTAEAVHALKDPRIAYRNLTQRLHFTDDPHKQWLVGATMARNEAMRMATGRWVVCFDDDDAMRPDCIEQLLARARQERLEAVYGRALVRREGQEDFAIGSFPPRQGDFTWASGMYHAGLRFLERELFAADIGLPGDWFLASRMLRAGVRFGMVDAVLCDLYPSAMNPVRAPGQPG